MTEPDRIWISEKWEAYLRPTFDGDTSGYIRADLARAPLAEAHPLASEARMALERDDVAGWIGSLTKARAAEALAVVLDALKDGEVWGRAVNAATPILRSDLDQSAWVTVSETREAIHAALRAIGEPRNG